MVQSLEMMWICTRTQWSNFWNGTEWENQGDCVTTLAKQFWRYWSFAISLEDRCYVLKKRVAVIQAQTIRTARGRWKPVRQVIICLRLCLTGQVSCLAQNRPGQPKLTKHHACQHRSTQLAKIILTGYIRSVMSVVHHATNRAKPCMRVCSWDITQWLFSVAGDTPPAFS